jgi:hypothetical protein
MLGNQIRLGEESDLIARYNFVNPKSEARLFYDPEIVAYSKYLEHRSNKANLCRRAHASGRHTRFKQDQAKYLQKYVPINFSDIGTEYLHRDNLMRKITKSARVIRYVTLLGYFSKFLKILSHSWKIIKHFGFLHFIFFVIGYSKKI